jgi:hypothetical protein
MRLPFSLWDTHGIASLILVVQRYLVVRARCNELRFASMVSIPLKRRPYVSERQSNILAASLSGKKPSINQLNMKERGP